MTSPESNTEKPSLIGSHLDLRAVDNKIDDQEADKLVNEGRWGFIHSEETGSAVDGPGLRIVFWTTGCEFRCLYCHNPDTWKMKNGQLSCVDDLLVELKKYEKYLRFSGGGVTVSGGEPLVQAPFVMNLLRGAKEMGIHTALDTNGFLGHRLSDEDLDTVDLFLLDIKSWGEENHRRLTAKPLEPVLNFARRIAERKRPAWLRFVLLPGYTDSPEIVNGIAGFAASLGNIERVDVLPFHQLGKFKWEQLDMAYDLTDAKAPSAESIAATQEIFRAHGLNCPS